MTEEEYLKKREAYAQSSADIETIKKAIQMLDDKYWQSKKLLEGALAESSDPVSMFNGS